MKNKTLRLMKDFFSCKNIFTETLLKELISKYFVIINCLAIDKDELLLLRQSIGDKDVQYLLSKYNNNTCFYQVNGTQDPPDFILIEHNTIIKIEAKSSKSNGIQFNSHIPDIDTIFFISAKAGNCVCIGEDIAPKEFADGIKKIYNTLNVEKEKLWKEELGDKADYWKPDYIRRMGQFNFDLLFKERNFHYARSVNYVLK